MAILQEQQQKTVTQQTITSVNDIFPFRLSHSHLLFITPSVGSDVHSPTRSQLSTTIGAVICYFLLSTVILQGLTDLVDA